MRAWGYCYIENLTWVLLRPNNSVLALPYRYAKTSHLTLYMFRREGVCSCSACGCVFGFQWLLLGRCASHLTSCMFRREGACGVPV